MLKIICKDCQNCAYKARCGGHKPQEQTPECFVPKPKKVIVIHPNEIIIHL